jgi:two-component system sensor kinase Ihk
MLYDIGKYKNHYIYLEKCKDIVSELSKMVQEILDTSKLNIINNKNESVLDLGSLVQKNIEQYKLIAKSKKINIKMNLKESFNIKVDEKLFTKAISNIISNAVNYTDEGKEIYKR